MSKENIEKRTLAWPLEVIARGKRPSPSTTWRRTRSPLQQVYGKFSPCLFVTASQLLWVDCQCFGLHWRGNPSCSDSASRRNSGVKFHVETRVSAMSVSRGRGCRSALTRVPPCTDERRASLILKTAAKLGTVYILLYTKYHLTFLPYLDMIVWSQLYYRLAWKTHFEDNCFELFLSRDNISLHLQANTNLVGEHYRLFSHSFTRLSKIVLEFKCALMAILSNTISIYLPDFM